MPQLQDASMVNVVTDNGAMAQVFYNQTQLGLAAPGTSNLIPTNGYSKFAFSCTSSSAGTISIQRYLDNAGSIPQGAPLTGSLTAATSATVNATDDAPFASLRITVTGGTLTATALLLQSM